VGLLAVDYWRDYYGAYTISLGMIGLRDSYLYLTLFILFYFAAVFSPRLPTRVMLGLAKFLFGRTQSRRIISGYDALDDSRGRSVLQPRRSAFGLGPLRRRP